MKKTILIFATIAFSISLSAQIYRPLSQFNGDIDKYLYFNFETQADSYKGKTFAYLMEKLEIQPIEFLGFMEMPLDLSAEGYDVFMELIFKHDHVNKESSYIRIVWETPILSTLVETLTKQYPEEVWVPQHYTFFKNMKIKAVRINRRIVHREGYKSNPEFELTIAEKKKLKKDELLK